MRIDEAIAHAREIADKSSDCWKHCVNDGNCSVCEKEHEQLADWLEELKRYKEIGTVEECMNSVLDIQKSYNKAIDDLRNELKNHYTEYNLDCILSDSNFYSYTAACDYLEDYIDKIAEKLKAGITND